jgi:hypothetical protein
MPSRKNRLEKGIESTKEQIEIHKEKRELAKQRGEMELEGYYTKEIEALQKVVKRKEEKLKK